MFVATNRVKNNEGENYVYSGYGIAFGWKDSWSFENDSTRNIVIFGVDNSSSSHTNSQKKWFFSLGEGPTYAITGSLGSPEKKRLVLILV